MPGMLVADRIDLLRAFVAVAELGGFTAAGPRLGRGQSTVSKQVAALERALGMSLVERTTRAVRLTPAGQQLLGQARGVLAAFDRALDAVAGPDPLHVRLRVTAPPNLALARLMPALTGFQALHSTIAIDTRFADARLDLPREGVDLAVRVGGLGGARGLRVGTARRDCVAAPAYLDRTGRPATPAELTGHRCLTYALLDAGATWSWTSGDAVAVSGPFSADDPQALRHAALAGLGVAVSGNWMFADDLAAGRLERVLPDHEPTPMPIHLVLRAGAAPPPALKLLAEHLTAAIAADPLLRP